MRRRPRLSLWAYCEGSRRLTYSLNEKYSARRNASIAVSKEREKKHEAQRRGTMRPLLRAPRSLIRPENDPAGLQILCASCNWF
jgi:hypothetical protein